MKVNNFSILNKTNTDIKMSVFLAVKKRISGDEYDLSVVIVNKKQSKELNLKYRKKDYPANILSFPLSQNSGEIFLNPESAKKDAKKFEMEHNEFLLFLFIHGLLHLKGFKHGSKMERQEKKILLEFLK